LCRRDHLGDASLAPHVIDHGIHHLTLRNPQLCSINSSQDKRLKDMKKQLGKQSINIFLLEISHTEKKISELHILIDWP
jgi:hypothetical protein